MTAIYDMDPSTSTIANAWASSVFGDPETGPTELWEAVEAETAALEGRGRILVRPSGTEPVVRVMAEAPAQEECEGAVARLSDVVARELGPGTAGD